MKRQGVSILISICIICTLFTLLALPAQAYTISDWVLESSAPAGAQITDRKWTYTKTTYVDSQSDSMPGYTLSGSEWVARATGSREYASFPTGYDTTNTYYTTMFNSPYTASETATTKRTVSNSWKGYIYWHWMYNCNSSSAYYRTIYDHKGTASYNNYYYYIFGAFKSTSGYTATGGTSYSCGTYGYKTYYNTGRTSYSDSQGSYYWYRFDYYTSTYTDYSKVFHYYKTEQLESDTELTESSSSSVVISNVQAYVKYKDSFTITYDANGGSDAPAPQTKRFGVPLTITSSVPTRPGYDFLGWSVSSDALAASYAPGGTFVADNSDYTLYAIWQNKTRCVVTYDYRTNGGTACSVEKESVYQGENANLSVTAARDGWDFVGWNTDSSATAGLSDLTVTADTTLYAIFSKTATACLYIGDNQLYSASSQTYYNQDAGVEVVLPPIPNYTDWTPVCWIRERDGKEFVAGSRVLTDGDTGFYAQYVKTLTLSYDANGGASTPSSQLVALYYLADGTYDQNEPVLAGAIERQGYSFDKWAYGSVDGTAYSAGDTLFLRENVTMYATWTELPTLEAPGITVTDTATGKTVSMTAPAEGADVYYTLDGSSPSEHTLQYGQPIVLDAAGQYTLKAVAHRQGYADSAVTIRTITVDRAAAPVSNLESGYVRADAALILSTESAGGTIYYTTDGSTPTTASDVYREPLSVTGDFTLKAITALPGHAVSACTTYTYRQAPVYTVDTFGYSFVNAAASFGYTSTMPSFLNYCIPYSSVKLIFGDSVKGKSVYTSMAKYAWSGNCCGMASTSALIFSTDTDITADSFGQATVNRLRVTDSAAKYDNMLVRTFIEAMQTAQYTVQFDRDYSENRVSNIRLQAGENLNALYQAVESDLKQSKNDIIAVGQSGVGAHALLAYEMREISDGESRLYVYDCNYPNDTERYVTLWRDADGNVNGWAYHMGRYGVWGSESAGNSYISYIPFDTIEGIWENRGRLFDNYLTLTVDSENVAIYDLNGELVGEFRDGDFYSSKDDVFAIPNLNLSSESDLSVYLPEDFYVVTNLDGGDFAASMVGESIGATVETNAETVCFELNESLRLNDISIEQAGTDSNYTISLDSSFTSTNQTAVFRNVTISGTGVGETMRLSSSASGAPMIENCNISSYKINGVEQINYMITALAGSGGSISPKGDVMVAAGSGKTFTITPDPGYRIKDVVVDGYSIGAEQAFTFEDVGKDHMIRATFEPAFSIDTVQLNGQTLAVGFQNDTAARLCAAVYTADGKLEALKLVPVSANASAAQIPLDMALPQRCKIKVFLLSDASMLPLCGSKSLVP